MAQEHIKERYYWESAASMGEFDARDDTEALNVFHEMQVPNKMVLYREIEKDRFQIIWEYETKSY